MNMQDDINLMMNGSALDVKSKTSSKSDISNCKNLENSMNAVPARIKVHDIVRHFKHELHPNLNPDYYLYIIDAFAKHTEDGTIHVVYHNLYTCEHFVRPYDMFMSEVDHVKYPNVTQKYRMEVVNMQ